MILVVGHVKGGVGKTTLTLNLTIARSAEGHDVLLVDGNEQGTAMLFTDLRTTTLGTPGYTAVHLQGAALRTQVRQLATKYADILIDVGGRDTGSLRAALTVAQTLLIPLQPRSFDIWAVDQMMTLLTEARAVNPEIRAMAVLNAADEGRDNQEAIAALKDIAGLQILPLTIGRRKAFPNAAAYGRAVTEATPRDAKAVAELSALLKALYS